MATGGRSSKPVRPDAVTAALRYHRREEFAAARRACLRAWENGSDDARVPYLMACLEAHADNLSTAASWFRHAARRDPHWNGRENTAAKPIPPALGETLAQDPQPDRICQKISLRLHHGGRHQAALLALKAWLTYAPGDVRAMEVMGEVAERIGEHALAVGVLGRARRLSPERADLALKLGNALYRQGEPRQALASYRQAERLDRGRWEAGLNAGLALQKLGRLAAAEEAFKKTIATHPGHAEPWYAYAALLFATGRAQDAIAHFEKTVAIDPDHADAWLYQAHAWKQLGVSKKAAAAFTRAAGLAPDNVEAHFHLGTTLHGLKDYRGAREALSRAAALAPDNPSVQFLLAAVRGRSVDRAPRAYVAGLFDRYAASFDRHMKGLLQYRLPALVRRHLKPIVKHEGIFRHLLDIGCGTGLVGEALRDCTRHMTGVDVARRILARAADKGLYDHLVHDDFHHYLAAAETTFDLVVAADVFIYTGALDEALALIRERLAPTGRLVFSTEKGDGEDGFRLQASGRFAHTHRYIERQARAQGFILETARAVPLRMERHRWINGDLYILAPTGA